MKKYENFFSLLSWRMDIEEGYIMEVKKIIADNHLALREKAHAIEDLTDSYKTAIKGEQS